MELNIVNLVSIIITTYSRTDFFLKRAINSVLNQNTEFNFEIVVVDDNGFGTISQIRTQTLINQFDNIDKINYIVHEKNVGACKARNNGVKHATGNYIFFLDDDDEFLPNKIQVQMDFLRKNEHLDGCLSAFKRLENDNEIIAKSNYPEVGNFVNFAINGNFFTPMLCIKKGSLNKIGGFEDIERFQDRYMMLIALVNGLKFECIMEPLHIMYEHNGFRITNKSIRKTIKSLDRIKDFIIKHKQKFTKLEWNNFIVRDLRARGTVYYVSDKYLNRIKSFVFNFKSFCITKQTNDLKMMLKSIFRFN